MKKLILPIFVLFITSSVFSQKRHERPNILPIGLKNDIVYYISDTTDSRYSAKVSDSISSLISGIEYDFQCVDSILPETLFVRGKLFKKDSKELKNPIKPEIENIPVFVAIILILALLSYSILRNKK